MQGQTPLPEVDGLAPPPKPTLCRWCLKKATTTIEVEPPIKGSTRYGKPVEKRRAITAPVCRDCKQRLENRMAK